MTILHVLPTMLKHNYSNLEVSHVLMCVCANLILLSNDVLMIDYHFYHKISFLHIILIHVIPNDIKIYLEIMNFKCTK